MRESIVFNYMKSKGLTPDDDPVLKKSTPEYRARYAAYLKMMG